MIGFKYAAVITAGLVCALNSLLMAQELDTRTYDQIAAKANKTVVDYFLLCPSIIRKEWEPGLPAALWIADSDDKLDVKGADLEFRRQLLSKSVDTKGTAEKSVVIDIPNAYIKIEGFNHGKYEFTLVFVYFERADKSRIPALTYNFAAMESQNFYHAFFDIRDSSWKPIPDDQILPPITEKPLLPYVGEGDASTTQWYLDDLPRYGTTVRFRAARTVLVGEGAPTLAKADDYLDQLKAYALECAWDKSQARFQNPKPAMIDRTDLPKSDATAADMFVLLPENCVPDLAISSKDRRSARDAWKNASHKTKDGESSFFEWDSGSGPDSCGVELKILGRYKGLPLVAIVEWAQEVFSLSVLGYHADSGLFERTSLLSYSAKDFYKEPHVSEAEKKLGTTYEMPCIFSMSEEGQDISAEPDLRHNPDIAEFPPDQNLSFRWDDMRGVFAKSAIPIDY